MRISIVDVPSPTLICPPVLFAVIVMSGVARAKGDVIVVIIVVVDGFIIGVAVVRVVDTMASAVIVIVIMIITILIGTMVIVIVIVIKFILRSWAVRMVTHSISYPTRFRFRL